METAISDRGRGPEIKGTRITVYDVYHYLESGDWQEQEIAEILGLSMDQLKEAIRFIGDNKTDIQKVHQQIDDRIARGNPPEIDAKLAESRKNREELLQQGRDAKHQEKNGVGDPCRR